MRKKNRLPKRKLLVGHTKGYDIYETPSGEIWLYSGNDYPHFKDPKYWRKEHNAKKRNSVKNHRVD